MDNELTMDRAAERLRKIHIVSGWMLDHWSYFPDNLHELLENGSFKPFDLKKFLVDLIRQDFANAITPAIGGNWRIFAEAEGIVLPDDKGSDK